MNINASAGLMEVMKSNLGPKGTLKMYKNKHYREARWRRRPNQANQGRSRVVEWNVDPTPNCRHDRQISYRLGRHCRWWNHLKRTLDWRFDEISWAITFRWNPPQSHHWGIWISQKGGIEVFLPSIGRFLDTFKIHDAKPDKAVLMNVARTALTTKLHPEMANHMVPLIVDAVQIIQVEEQPIDLFMVEIMHM